MPFEIVFVGPSPPTQKMPDNFRHIVSDATPCQCVEIAVMNAVGEYIVPLSDDVTLSDGYLNKFYNYIQRFDRDKVLISSRFWVERADKFGDDGLMFDGGMPTVPVMGVCPAFRRDLWIKLGGLDRRFHGTFCDMDMQMRFYEYGMQPFITPDCWINEIVQTSRAEKKKTLFSLHGADARRLLNSLWIVDGTISPVRLSPVEPFTSEERYG